MMNVLPCFLFAGFVTGTVAPPTAERPTPIEIRFASGGVKVDADASDWEGVHRHPVAINWDGQDRPRDDDLTVDAAFLFDANHLYVLVEATDDAFQFPDRSWRYGDGFYLTLAEPTPEFRSNRYVTFGLSIEKGRLTSKVVSRDGVGFPSIDSSGITFAAVSDLEAHRIVYEAAIPWHLVNPLQPLVDEVWGMNLIYVDGEQGRREIVSLHHDRDYDTENTDLRRTTQVKFVLDGITESFVQYRPYCSHVRSGESFPVGIGAANIERGRDSTVEWRVTDSLGRKVDRGTAPCPLHESLARSRVEVPLGDLQSGPFRVSVFVKTDEGERLGRASFPVLIINASELERQRSTLERFSKDEQIAENVRASLPSALFHLETVEAFLTRATPLEDVGDAATGIDRVKEAIGDLEAGLPVFANRRGVFRHAHRSAIDGTLQPYSVAIPEDYSAGRKYPLLVMLHGSGVDERDVIYDAAALGTGRLNWIGMAPKARGLSDWYLGDSGRDVFECIADVSKRYSIDSKCIVLMGFSSGGFGAWRLGLQRPDLFAGVVPLSAPLAARGENVAPLLSRVEGLPLFVAHGTGDHAVSIEEARRAVGILRERVYPLLTYHEIEGAGHGNYNSRILPDLIAWLREREQGK